MREYHMNTAIKHTLWTKQAWLISILLVIAFLSGVMVVVEKDTYRQKFILLHALQKQHVQYKTKWSQLILEESTWGALPRVDRIATETLNMTVPKAKQMKILEL